MTDADLTEIDPTLEHWVRRCAARYVERAGLGWGEAWEAASRAYQAELDTGGDFSDTPEDIADADMDAWHD